MRVSAEYDSEEGMVLAKASASLLKGLAKIKASCQAALDGTLGRRVLTAVVAKTFQVDWDIEEGHTLCSAQVDLGKTGTLMLQHDSMTAQSMVVGTVRPAALLGLKRRTRTPFVDDDDESLIHGASAEVQLTSAPGRPVQPTQMSRLAVLFPPLGHIQFIPPPAMNEEEEEEESAGESGFSGAIKMPLRKGGLGADEGETSISAHFSEQPQLLGLGLRHKNKVFTVAPQISLLPLPSLELGFKRRFSPTHKVSLLYNASDASFAATYKCTPKFQGKKESRERGNQEGEEEDEDNDQPLKLKIGYDSRLHLMWSSLWVGREDQGAKHAPFKTRVQVMLQVQGENDSPADLLRNTALMFRVKKRIDIL